MFSKKEIFKGKSILDMGCGGGIQGIIALLFGEARHLTSVDISDFALKAVKINKILMDTTDQKHKIIKSNLFSNIKSKHDIIIFNPPYIQDIPIKPVDYIVKMPKESFQNFFNVYKNYLNEEGFVIMAFTHIGINNSNNPMSILKKKNIFYKEEKIVDEIGEHSFIIF